jgi:glucosamine-6-phosphate deaminase
MTEFKYSPAACIPFRDMDVIRRVRQIRREDIARHPNPDFQIRVVPDSEIEFLWMADMFHRLKSAADEGRQLVMITPNPWPSYSRIAYLINRFRVDCRKLWTFNMDEYANEHGEIAPETWEFGFMYAFKKYFWQQIDPALRQPERQVLGPTTANINDYGKMLADLGGADICYSGPGWTGHLAFIEPDAPEFAGDLDAWKRMGPRVCTLSPFTIAQNSMHGSFGAAGDLCAVPPKAATIGPAEVIAAKNRFDMHAIRVDGSRVSWQRMTTRLVLHGPVTPRLPQSILQTLRTDVYVAESAAENIAPQWSIGY